MEGVGLKISKGSMICMKGVMNESQLYILQGKTIIGEADFISKQSTTSSTNLWHLRLGHISMKGIDVLAKDQMLLGDKIEPIQFCDSCVMGKSHRVKFNLSGLHKSKGILDYVHTDHRQRQYYDPRHRAVEFQVGDFVFLRVSPMKGVSRFGRAGKLSPRFVGPFEVVGRVGTSAYRVALPPHMSDVHDVFHVSVLRRFVSDADRRVSEEEVEVRPDLTFRETPERVLARDVRQLRNKRIIRSFPISLFIFFSPSLFTRPKD